MTRLPQSDCSPLPTIDQHSAPHWEGLARGALVLPRCDVCCAHNHPAVRACHVCESPQLTWEDVGPAVRLYSWAVEVRPVIQGMHPPFVIAQVTPEVCEMGDVRLIGTLLADPAALELGMALTLRPVRAPGSALHIATYVPA